MCLAIHIKASTEDRDLLVQASHEASKFGLQVEVDHRPRWPWAQRQPALAWISEDGACACSLLSDDADWHADTWKMRPEIVEPLALTLGCLVEHGPPRLTIQALWAGDRIEVEHRTDPAGFLDVVRTTGLGTRCAYMVERAAA